jgi:hypothetical protein
MPHYRILDIDDRVYPVQVVFEQAEKSFGRGILSRGENGHAALRSDAAVLKTVDTTMLIEGHCDEPENDHLWQGASTVHSARRLGRI